MSIFELITDEKCESVTTGGKQFYVRYIDALERDRFEQQWQNYKAGDSVIGIRAFLVAFCLCDAEGNKEFDSGDKAKASKEFCDAVVKIGTIKAQLLQPVFNLAMEINGFSEGDVDDLEKKSE